MDESSQTSKPRKEIVAANAFILPFDHIFFSFSFMNFRLQPEKHFNCVEFGWFVHQGGAERGRDGALESEEAEMLIL